MLSDTVVTATLASYNNVSFSDVAHPAVVARNIENTARNCGILPPAA